MNKILFTGLAGLALFEILKVYFIMPLPGSQILDSLTAAYFLHTYRWLFRIAFLLVIAAGSTKGFPVGSRILPAGVSLATIAVVLVCNFQMTAESMFKQPRMLTFSSQGENEVDDGSIVIGIEHSGEAKAYPIRFLVYHHQVRDTVGGKAVMVTYCSVCRDRAML